MREGLMDDSGYYGYDHVAWFEEEYCHFCKHDGECDFICENDMKFEKEYVE